MLSCVIVDDEQLALNILIKYVERTPFLELKMASTNALEAQTYIQQNNIDIVFLDIQMPDLDGISFLTSLSSPPKVIFTTAYDQYALKGYELEIVDYLLKPISFERFLKASNKTLQLKDHSEQKLMPDAIWVKADYQQKKVVLSDILFVEGLKDYVKIYTYSGLIMTKLNLKNFHLKLPNSQFIRVHRSFIVNLSKITSVQKSRLYIEEREIPVSEPYWDQLSNTLHL
ncbi:MAG: response regulator transcription factor [Flavobacteriales bacterium]|nr:response regulator transcription factor [Flavobacteriales bacterium]